VSAAGRRRMKPRIARIGPLVPAIGAVGASVALSLLILHPPALTLFPGTAPADRGQVGALILPAPHVSPPAASTQPQVLQPVPSEIVRVVTPPTASHPAAPSKTPTGRPSPPVENTPPPTTPTPPTVPTVPTVATPAVSTNNGRWSSPTTKTWKAAAAKQNQRTVKGKPPWAGPKKSSPAAVPTPAATAPTTSTTPPGQAKVPPGQAKKANKNAPPAAPTAPPAAAPDTSNTPPGQAKVPPGQGKKAK
jgi:hypothetical protein